MIFHGAFLINCRFMTTAKGHTSGNAIKREAQVERCNLQGNLVALGVYLLRNPLLLPS